MNNEEILKFLQEYINTDNSQKHSLVLETCKQNPYLYRYRPMKANFDFDALFNNQFWIQSANKQNDELEGISFLTSFDVIRLKSAKIVPKHLKSKKITMQNKRMRNELKKFRQYIGIVCFSEDMNNKKMWTKYAESYSGICIEYKKQDFVNADIHIMPVYYKEKRLVSDFFSFIPKDKGKSLELRQNEKFPPQISLAYKTLKWEYEKEWRHIELIQEGVLPDSGIFKDYLVELSNHYTIKQNNIKQKHEEITKLKNNYLDGVEKTCLRGKLIPAIKPNKIFIGENMKRENIERIVEFCKNNEIGYEFYHQPEG